MTDTQKNFEAVLKVLAKAESLLSDGHNFEEVCEQLAVDEEELSAWADHLSLPPNTGDILGSSHLLEAVFPVFAADSIDASIDHVGSGVLIEIGGDLFALTAAHIIDHAQGNGTIFMPSADGIVQMTGGLSFNPVPERSSRARDIEDVGYVHLSQDWRGKLHPLIKPLSIHDLLLTDSLETGDIFTFVGYPWRKTKSRIGVQETDRTTYTGHAVAPDIYEQLEYNRSVNVLIRMRRKKAYSTRYASYQVAPHPQGISGGAVIAWPSTFTDRLQSSNLKLAAIGHTYNEQCHCMAATRIIPYMMAIVRNNPQLAVHFNEKGDIAEDFGAFLVERMKKINLSNVPSAVGIGWYTSETYEQCINLFDDGADLPGTFDEWKQLAESTERQLMAQGMKVVRVEINPATFPAWCNTNGFTKIDRHARMAFGNTKALEALQ